MTDATTWMNLENMLSKRKNPHTKDKYYIIHLYEMFKIGKSIETKVDQWLIGALGRGGSAGN